MAHTSQPRTVGRAPTARIAKAATELEDHGFDLEIDTDNERAFKIWFPIPGRPSATNKYVAREIVENNRLEMEENGNSGIVHVPGYQDE